MTQDKQKSTLHKPRNSTTPIWLNTAQKMQSADNWTHPVAPKLWKLWPFLNPFDHSGSSMTKFNFKDGLAISFHPLTVNKPLWKINIAGTLF